MPLHIQIPAVQQPTFSPIRFGYMGPGGQTTTEPGQMLLIKNDPQYNEQWPRPLVPYERIYGVKEPATLVHRNDGKRSPHLPEGTPFGLIGSSSMSKRESAPLGRVPEGKVTAETPVQPGNTIYTLSQFRDVVSGTNWDGQGADAGRYDNSDIHAIRILIQEPLTDVKGHRSPLFGSHANERLRILGEIPVRKCNVGRTGSPSYNRRQPAHRSRRQSRHQLLSKASRQPAVHVPDD